MASTGYGSPYVESSDLVSAWPATSQSVADRIDDVAIKGNGVNAQSGTTYTTVLTDAGKVVSLENASPVTVTIPTNASVAYETGTRINFLNLGAGTVTLAGAGGVTVNGDTLTIDQYAASSAVKIDTDEWVVLPFSSGVGSAAISNTPTGSYTGYEYVSFTTSGTLTVTKAGYIDYLVVGGGGAGHNIGINVVGCAGDVRDGSTFLTAGNHTITVGAGGVGTNSDGAASSIGSQIVTQIATWGQGPNNLPTDGWTSSITGSAVLYAGASGSTATYGKGGTSGLGSGTNGIVIVRWAV